jgi:hypothetical protein
MIEPKRGASGFLRNAGNYLPYYAASHSVTYMFIENLKMEAEGSWSVMPCT